jgi:uncharacterized membrane protein YraQ (UPF0718 family)/copper chaperone CopZ
MTWLTQYLVALWAVGAQLSPWLLLGCLLAGVMHVVIPQDMIRKHLGGNRIINVIKAVLLGVPLPLCSCSVLPAGVALKKEGAGDGAAVGFLISTPQTGVDSITVSAAMLGWPFAVLKVVAAIVTGLVGGLLTNLTAPPLTGPAAVAHEPESPRSHRSLIGMAGEALEYGYIEVLSGIWKWLLIGLAVSALVSTLVAEQSLADHAWASGFSGLLVMLVVGIPLYVCNTGSLPIAAALVRAGVSPGAALVFLMAGPATNAATIGAVWRTFGRRVTAIYLGAIVAGSLLFGWVFDAVVTPVRGAAEACHTESPGWLGTLSLLVLLALCAYLAWPGRGGKAAALGSPSSPAKSAPNSQPIEIAVTGLTCAHCARTLQQAISALAGVTAVAVNHETGTLSVTGHGVSRDLLRQTVREAGFRAAGSGTGTP